VKVTVEQKGTGRAVLDLHALGVRASDVRTVGKKIGRIVAASNKRRFDTRGQGRWKPLDPATKEQKAKSGHDPRPMRQTGKLYDSLTDPTPLSEKPTELTFGTKLPYAGLGDKGTENQPARKLIELKPDELQEITDLLGRYIGKGTR
jgi:phage gpG-like protein